MSDQTTEAQRLETRIRELRAIEYPSIVNMQELDRSRNRCAELNESATRERFGLALASFQRATAALLNAWDELPGDIVADYPSYLPSFDEFAANVSEMTMVGEEK